MNEDRLFNLWYWRELISRQRWLILGCIMGVAILTTALSLAQSPVYRSTCRLYLSKQKVQPLSFPDIFQEERGRVSDVLMTQVEMLRSVPILEMAVRDLEQRYVLTFEGPRETPERGRFQLIVDRVLGREVPSPQTADDKRSAFVLALQGSVGVQSTRGTAFLSLSVSSDSPQLSAELANAIVHAYLRNDRDMRQRSAQEAISWLSNKVREQRDKLLTAEKQLRTFKKVPRDEVEEVDGMAVQEITGLQQALLDVRLQLLQTEAWQVSTDRAQPQAANPAGEAALEAQVQGALRERVQRELVETAVMLNQLRQRYGERHPDVIKATEQEVQLRQELARLGPSPVVAGGVAGAGTSAADVAAIIESLRAQERALGTTLERAMATSLSKGQEGMNYAIVKREVEINRSLYNEMLSRLNELTISAGLDSPSAEVFEPARPEPGPVSPNHLQNLLLGLAAGLFLGIGSAAIRDHLDQSVRDPAHAHDLLRVPVLGMIPHHGYGAARATDLRRRLAIASEPASAQAEAYRVLRAHIEGALTEDEAGVLVLTSAVPGEGKSSTAANLAAAFAESGRRVLLIDGDIRRPSLMRYFDSASGTQLSDVLQGEISPEEGVRPTRLENLDLLPCATGRVFPDSLRLTESLKRLFGWARERYERVVIDAPVVMAVPGVSDIAHAGALVLLVHRPGWVPAHVLEQVREHLLLSKARLGGVVLNAVRVGWATRQYPLAPYYSETQRLSGRVEIEKSDGGLRS